MNIKVATTSISVALVGSQRTCHGTNLTCYGSGIMHKLMTMMFGVDFLEYDFDNAM